jgi:hypothetical protein
MIIAKIDIIKKAKKRSLVREILSKERSPPRRAVIPSRMFLRKFMGFLYPSVAEYS